MPPGSPKVADFSPSHLQAAAQWLPPAAELLRIAEEEKVWDVYLSGERCAAAPAHHAPPAASTRSQPALQR